MAYRSPSTRVAWTSFVGASCAALGSLLFAGCQSGAQYDQVARELRLQEDQLYALEDYLEEYQQLVCKYRAENAALKRQLADNGMTPNGTPRKNDRTRPAGPGIDVTPPANGMTPPSEIDEPDIPPLEATTSDDSDSRAPRRSSRGRVILAAAQGAEVERSAARAIALEQVDDAPMVNDVWLHGEVVANESGGGPRVLVDVEPLDADGRATAFDGALSLMLTAPNDDGSNASVARWDYRPQDVRAATVAESDGKTIRFHLELPPETPVMEGTQLWVRLLQRRGAKLLAHAEIKLHEPSLFSSRTENAPDGDSPLQLAADAESMVAAADDDVASGGPSIDGALPPDVAPLRSGIFDGGWTIAKPGQPAGLPQDTERANNDWRASLEPPPSVTASSVATKPKPRVSWPREPTVSRNVAAAKTTKRATWSPDRMADAPAGVSRTASRPTWSATR